MNRRIAILLLLALSAAAQPQFVISDYTLVYEQRIDRTHWLVEYSCTLYNVGAGQQQSMTYAQLSSGNTASFTVSPVTFEAFDPVQQGESTPGLLTFYIIVDRSVPFSEADLVWRVFH